MGKVLLFSIFGEGNDGFPFEVGQAFVIGVAECFAHDLLHDGGVSFAVESGKGIVVESPVDELDIDGHMSLADQVVVVKHATDPAVAINKWVDVFEGEVEACDTFDDVFLTTGSVGDEHLAEKCGNVRRICGNMAADPDPFVRIT